MIRVERPEEAPPVLLNRGVEHRDEMCDLFDSAPDDYQSGAKKLEPKSSIYGHASVKDALRAAQHGKCCFCEADFTHVAHGDVEHFRPKAGFQQKDGDPISKPGYYWLAYEWTNLFFSCQICNQTYKRNFFPLSNPTKRARSHHDNVGAERAVLIDPAVEDPERFIGFREEVAFPKNNSRRAKATIALVSLNRPQLLEARREYLEPLKLLRALLKSIEARLAEGTDRDDELTAQAEQIRTFLQQRRKSSSQFTSMSRAALT